MNVALISLVFVLLCFMPSYSQTAGDAAETTGIRRIYGGNWFVCNCQTGTDIRMDSFGDETSVSFTINWDPLLVHFIEANKGADLPTGSVITLNKSQLALGRLGVSVVSPTALPGGNVSILRMEYINVREVEAHSTGVTFSSSITPQVTRDVAGTEVQTIFESGRASYGSCDPTLFMGLAEVPAAAGTAMLDIGIGEAFARFSGETSFRFSLAWDRTRFSFLSVLPGTGLMPGSKISLDESMIEEGRIGIIINGTSPLPPFSTNVNLAKLQLAHVAGIDNGSHYVHFTNEPVARTITDASGIARFGTANAVGRISVGSRTSLTGTLRRPSGQPIANTVVVLQGTQLTATTSSFGVFNFPSVPHGYGFRIQVRSKRYRFASLPIYLNHAADVEIRGLE